MRNFNITDAVPVPIRVVVVPPATKLPAALQLMRERRIHHLVVGELERVMGVVSDRNLFERGLTGTDELCLSRTATVESVMCRLDHTITEHSDLREAIHLMRALDCSALPLVRDGHPIGIVTETDLLRLLELALGRDEATGNPAEQAADRGLVALSNPLVQNLMFLLAEAGI